MGKRDIFSFLLLMIFCLSVVIGCAEKRNLNDSGSLPSEDEISQPTKAVPASDTLYSPSVAPPYPLRPNYMPGELVDYTVRSGDTLPALAARFNTSELEIMTANPIIPADVSTLPPGMPMQIPIHFRSQWGIPFEILPDFLFSNGPAQVGFTARSFVDRQPGWFKYYSTYTGEANRRGGEIIDYIAVNYSISPRLLLALLEYQTGALTNSRVPENLDTSSVLGFPGVNSKQLSAQLNKLANFLNEAFYEVREGRKLEYELRDGSLYRMDPWLNPASAALQHYFSRILSKDQFFKAVSEDGFRKTYQILFGDFPADSTYIPGSLNQPLFQLPFAEGMSWAYTGGPHPAWGDAAPNAAIDFAPPSTASGCVYSDEWVLAPASGTIVRTGTGIAVLDLDSDGDERTGWNLFFLHLLTPSIPPVGTVLEQGDPIGHPSCDGGVSTGTHVHIARKYNGDWFSAGGIIPFEFDNWKVENGNAAYSGSMRRFQSTVIACECADFRSLVHNGPPLVPTPTVTPKPK